MKKVFFVFLSILMLVTACSGGTIENRLDWDINTFEFTNQDQQPVSLSDLEGKVLIADFIFTSCSTVCPTLTANMAKLQKRMKEEGLDVQFVSFSVDPEVDTPERLKEYAGKFTTDLSNWHFLTGYAFDEIQTFAEESFQTLVLKSPGSTQVTHGTSFYLIDQDGKVAKAYNGNKDVPYDQMVKDVKILLNQ